MTPQELNDFEATIKRKLHRVSTDGKNYTCFVDVDRDTALKLIRIARAAEGLREALERIKDHPGHKRFNPDGEPATLSDALMIVAHHALYRYAKEVGECFRE